jgi:CheY-like chemotaxis protein/signal transduction histidine kinase
LVEVEYMAELDQLVIASDTTLRIVYCNMHEGLFDKIVDLLHGLADFECFNNYIGQQLDGFFAQDSGYLNTDPQTMRSLSDMVTVLDVNKATADENISELFRSEEASKVYRFISTFEKKSRMDEGKKSCHQLYLEKHRNQIASIQLLECQFNTYDFLQFLKECCAMNNEFVDLHGSIVLKFFLSNSIQLKFQIIPIKGKMHVFTVFENIEEKITMGYLNSKLNYSQMLICSMSHELYTPINQLVGATDRLLQMVIKEKTIPPNIKEETKLVSQISHCLTLFVQNTLDFARYINRSLSLTPETFNLRPCIESVMEMFKIKAKKSNIILELACPEDLELYTDQDKVMGLLFIFLENSMKYTQKGRISVRILPGKTQGLSEELVTFEIRDTGLGIDEAELAKIAEILDNPFADLSTSGAAGIGIGFRVAQILLIQLFKGDISLEVMSKKGEGTVITYEILKNIAASEEEDKRSNYDPQQSLSRFLNTERQEGDLIRKINTLCSNEISQNKKEQTEVQSSGPMPYRSDNLHLDSSPLRHPGTSPASEYSPEEFESQSQEDKCFIMPDPNLEKQEVGSHSPPTHLIVPPAFSSPKLLKGIGLSPLKKHPSIVRLRSYNSRGKSQLSLVDPDGVEHPVSPRLDDSYHSNNNYSRLSKNSKGGPSYKRMNTATRQPSEPKPVAVVVDDEVLNIEFLKDWLENLGYTVHTAIDGDLALDLCSKLLILNIKVDVIFMDYSMPTMNGVECTRRLRMPRFDPILQGTKIIGVTAHKDTAVAEQCRAAGMDIVCYKPFKFKDFTDVMTKMGKIQKNTEGTISLHL